MLTHCFKILFRLCLSVMLFLLIFLALAWLLPFFQLNKTQTNSRKTTKIMIVSSGVHTDIAVPATSSSVNWQVDFPADNFSVKGKENTYIAFGWGDKEFYLNTPTWGDLKATTVIKALSGFNETAMHVRYLKEETKDNNHCQLLWIDSLQYRHLITCIKNSFQEKGGHFIKLTHPGYGNMDRFYEARGHYSLFNTCNNWTCTIMRKSGLKVACWSPLAGPLLRSVK